MGEIRLLIVDDSDKFINALVNFLKSLTGIVVAGIGRDGFSGLSLANELRPDVVLIDINMPGLNGVETAYRMRKLLPQVCIILTSTMYVTSNFFAEIARESGADDYISKIDLADRLIPAIHRSLQRNEQLAIG